MANVSNRLPSVVYINGEFRPSAEAAVSVFDHGLLYGDGVFDTLFAKYGYVFKLQEHLERFERSLRAIALEIPLKGPELAAAIVDAVARNGFPDAYIKIIASRGQSAEPLLDPRGCTPTTLIFVRPYLWLADPSKRQSGLSAKVTTIRRVPADSLEPRIKSLNYLNLVLAKIEAINAGCDEALLPDEHGMICEAPGYNVFLVSGNELSTPERGILEGITRATVIELSSGLGLRCRLRSITSYDLYNADEIVLTSTAAGLMPVTRIDGRTIGVGKPGPVFAQLDAAYDALLRSGRHGTPVPGLATEVSRGI